MSVKIMPTKSLPVYKLCRIVAVVINSLTAPWAGHSVHSARLSKLGPTYIMHSCFDPRDFMFDDGLLR